MIIRDATNPGTATLSIDSAEDALRLARIYLAAIERRDVEAAARCLAPDAVLTFPGGIRRKGAAGIASGSASRYRRIGKVVEAWEVYGEPGAFVVYCRGTLHGEWLDGAPFTGIRFVDRFEINARAIRRQDVWNDAGEHRLARRAVQDAMSEVVSEVGHHVGAGAPRSLD